MSKDDSFFGNPVYELDVRYPCGVCGVDSGEDCKPVKKLTQGEIDNGYVHLGRRVKRLLAERRTVAH